MPDPDLTLTNSGEVDAKVIGFAHVKWREHLPVYATAPCRSPQLTDLKMSQPPAQQLQSLTERLYGALYGVSPITPAGNLAWSDADAELVAQLAGDVSPDLQRAGQAARHGLLNVRRIVVGQQNNPHVLDDLQRDLYRQYHAYASSALFSLLESLRTTPRAHGESDSGVADFVGRVMSFFKRDA